MKINIDWNKGIKLEASYSLKSTEDYGLYQVYGTYPVYGNNTLLYIGKAASQYFGVRLKQHNKWFDNQDSENIVVYTGRIGSNNPSDDWDNMIDIAEKLLIFSHRPAENSLHINTANNIPIETHIFNWGNRGLLLPEVSAFRYLANDEVYFSTYETLTEYSGEVK